MLKQGHDNLNKAYEGSPDVDPQAKVWSEAGSMARRAGSMQRDVQAMISKANRKAPRGFNLMQMKVTSGFKEVKETGSEWRSCVKMTSVHIISGC